MHQQFFRDHTRNVKLLAVDWQWKFGATVLLVSLFMDLGGKLPMSKWGKRFVPQD